MTLTSKHTYWIYAVIVVLVLAIYGNTINHEFVMDDSLYIVNNKVVQNHQWENIFTKSSTWGNDGVNDGAYRPIVLASFVLDHVFFGDKPSGYHVIQIVLYAVLCVLIFVFLRKLLKSENLWIPTIITLLFVAHPIHTEVVANIKSRDEILGMLFLIISGIAFLNYIKASTIDLKNKKSVIEDDSKQSISWLFLSIMAYFLALLSKETYVALLLLFPAFSCFSLFHKLEYKRFRFFKKSNVVYFAATCLFSFKNTGLR